MPVQFTKHPKLLFLIDSCGALLTAFLVGMVLPRFQSLFGMQTETLTYLALIALVFAVYSFACYFFAGKRWRMLMRIIASANLLYCVLTLLLVCLFHKQVTLLGFVYFGGEMVIVAGLAFIELRTASQARVV
jgi:type III secretory pathway component EscS